MIKRIATSLTLLLASFVTLTGQEQVVRVALAYRAPDGGPTVNFSPKGTQVPIAAVAKAAALPEGAARPAKSGVMRVGPNDRSWIPVLATADADHPNDITRLFVDRNRNGNFADDGPAAVATPSQNEKTKAWWSSFNKIEVQVPYAAGVTEPYLVNFWIVREDGAETPDILRFSVGSWRAGTATVNGVPALVAVMSGDSDAVWSKDDMWSAMGAAEPNAAKAVLTLSEARGTNRLMFVKNGDKDIVLEFRSLSPDGRSLTLAVIDRPVTKAADRAPDDTLAVERVRPRAKAPVAWGHSLDGALALAKSSGKHIFIDFETTWCGPCKTMDEWIWTDADVAARMADGYVGVKLDGDIEKAIVKRFNVTAYPTMIVLDSAGKEIKRLVGYQTSKEMLAALKPAPPGADKPY